MAKKPVDPKHPERAPPHGTKPIDPDKPVKPAPDFQDGMKEDGNPNQ